MLAYVLAIDLFCPLNHFFLVLLYRGDFKRKRTPYVESQEENDNPTMERLKREDVVDEGQVQYILGTFACYLATKVPINKNTGNELSAPTIRSTILW